MVIALALASLTLRQEVATNTAAAAGTHRIGVRPGAAGLAELFDRTSGVTFTPQGNNYVRLASQTDPAGNSTYYHSTFNVGTYDATRIEVALTTMATYRYNSIRVWLNGCCTGSVGNPAGGLSTAYLANVVDFLKRCRSHGIYAILTTDWPPSFGGYTDNYAGCTAFASYNLVNLCAGGVAANVAFFRDLAQGLVAQGAPLDAILAYELRNEYYYESDHPPLSWTSGPVTTANGLSYDMGSASSRQQMMDDGLVYFVDQVRAAILAVDPTALVGVGFFWPQDPNPTRIGDPRVIEVYPAIDRSTVDLVDIHGYAVPADLTVPQLLENYKLAGHQQTKPIVLGEFGTFKSSYPSISAAAAVLQDWQLQTCAAQLKGWLLWTWDTQEPEAEPPMWAAVSGDGSINRSLAPSFRADPCSATPVPGHFFTVAPCRVADTRAAEGPSGAPVLAANQTRRFPVSGLCGVPWTAVAVAANVTAVDPTEAGDLRAYPAGTTIPPASVLNFTEGRVRANDAVVALGVDGQIAIQCDMSATSRGHTHVIVDVTGYFQ